MFRRNIKWQLKCTTGSANRTFITPCKISYLLYIDIFIKTHENQLHDWQHDLSLILVIISDAEICSYSLSFSKLNKGDGCYREKNWLTSVKWRPTPLTNTNEFGMFSPSSWMRISFRRFETDRSGNTLYEKM